MSLASLADSGSIPSLTLTATHSGSSSSFISSMPESSSSGDLKTHERARRDSHHAPSTTASKRVSASSTASSAYSSNLKVGMSPSIGQVLDRTREISVQIIYSFFPAMSRGTPCRAAEPPQSLLYIRFLVGWRGAAPGVIIWYPAPSIHCTPRATIRFVPTFSHPPTLSHSLRPSFPSNFVWSMDLSTGRILSHPYLRI
ncbi:hypothetical protein BDW22DRAFT_427823 [Trametopsis cervina]|nr:hypothetical protein BDW22DRAFT_427823 [Trametopsis cervina]